MARNQASEARKDHFVSILKDQLGGYHRPHPSRGDWYCFNDAAVSVFITDSEMGNAWFDMGKKDIDELAIHPSGFVLFVMGDVHHYLVIPAKDLKAQLAYHSTGCDKEGHYNLHFLEDDQGLRFREILGWDLFPYLNEIDIIQSAQPDAGHNAG